MLDILKDWRLMIPLIITDRILTIYIVGQLGISVEINPLMVIFWPYSLILLPIPVLLIVYYLRKKTLAIQATNIIWLMIVLVNLVQTVDYMIGLQIITRLTAA